MSNLVTNNPGYRQIHLDFHTSEQIQGIASQFDATAFAKTLKEAHVDSVTCFARCHHGMIYYDSKRNPERIHPHLIRKNMLKEQIDACRKQGIKVPVYTTVQWDYYTSMRHPEWCCLNEDGSINGWEPYQAGFYANLCVNTDYLSFLKAHTAEVIDEMDPDGLFFDIVHARDCSCRACKQDMIGQGLEPSNKTHRLHFARKMIDAFKKDMSAFVRERKPECMIFYNAGHVDYTTRKTIDAYTHLELESLPSGGWGYMHFPVTMRYARNLHSDCLGMTGKFHTTWGDFHSFKNIEALRYECFLMIALNAKCSIGDQLEPHGVLSSLAYERIGDVYAQIKMKQPWCEQAKPIVEIGVFIDEKHEGHGQGGIDLPALGVVSMLQQGAYQFDLIDHEMDFSKYRLLILPDNIHVHEALQKKLQDFLDAGGKVIASFRSGVTQKGYALDYGLQPIGEQVKDVIDQQEVAGRAFAKHAYADFISLRDAKEVGLADTEYVMYIKGLQAHATKDASVPAVANKPWFNRDYRHFCSHNQTPSSGQKEYDAIVQNKNIIWFAHPIFTQYAQKAPLWCKKMFFYAIDRLMPQKIVKHDGPSGLIATVNQQAEYKRLVVHLLFYTPERRGNEFDVIEDTIPLHDLTLWIKAGEYVQNVTAVPQGQTLKFTQQGDYVTFTVPRMEGHQMIEIDY